MKKVLQREDGVDRDREDVLGKRKREIVTENSDRETAQSWKMLRTVHEEVDSALPKATTTKSDYWRAVACEVVGADPAISDVLLYNQMLKMNRLLDSLPSSVVSDTGAPLPTTSSYGIVWRVYCAVDMQSRIFQEEPQKVEYGSRPEHIAAKAQVSSIELFEAQHGDMSFLIINDLACCKPQTSGMDNHSKERNEVAPGLTKLKLYSPDLVRGLISICNSSPRFALYPQLKLNAETPNPHLWVFRDQHHITAHLEDPEECVREQLILFMKYFLDHKGEEFESVANSISRGFISPQLIEYLFVRLFVFYRHW
jgi:hypothetical protein